MQIVINIPDKYMKGMKVENGSLACEYILEAVYNGIVLPKGHGRLIDADALPLNDIDDANYGSNYIRIAPTIIEADKGGD